MKTGKSSDLGKWLTTLARFQLLVAAALIAAALLRTAGAIEAAMERASRTGK